MTDRDDGPDGPQRRDQTHRQLSLLSQPAEVRRTLDAIVQHLRDGDIPKDRIADAQIVLGEVLNNIVEHAYDGAAGEAILIDLWLTHAEIRCRIRDHGRPMPYGRLPSPTPPDLAGHAATDLPEGGFGWLLIHQISTALTYRRDGGENRLSLTLPAR